MIIVILLFLSDFDQLKYLMCFSLLEYCVEFDKTNVSANWTAAANATTPATEFWE